MCAYVPMFACAFVHMFSCACVCMRARVCVCACVYVWASEGGRATVMALAFSVTPLVSPIERKGSRAGLRAGGTARSMSERCLLLAGDDDGIMWAWRVPTTPRSSSHPAPPAATMASLPRHHRHSTLARSVRADVRGLLQEEEVGAEAYQGMPGPRGNGEAEEGSDAGDERGAISAIAVLDSVNVVVTGVAPHAPQASALCLLLMPPLVPPPPFPPLPPLLPLPALRLAAGVEQRGCAT